MGSGDSTEEALEASTVVVSPEAFMEEVAGKSSDAFQESMLMGFQTWQSESGSLVQ